MLDTYIQFGVALFLNLTTFRLWLAIVVSIRAIGDEQENLL